MFSMQRVAFWLLLVFAMLAGCTNSKLVLSPLYNRLDDQIRGEFNKLGDFNDWQKSSFEVRLQTFHLWHRRQELPAYATLLREVSNTISKKGQVTTALAVEWTETIEAGVKAFQSCYPAHYSIDLLKTLTPRQIGFIERRFARERLKNKTKYASKTRDERMQERLSKLTTWTGLAGFTLTKRQKKLILKHMSETRSLHDEYYVLTDLWNKKLFKLLRNPDASNYEEQMAKHLKSLYGLLEIHHASTHEFNRRVWQDFIVEFDKTLGDEQRGWLRGYVRKLGKNINAISKAKVSFKPHTDASMGCIAGSDI